MLPLLSFDDANTGLFTFCKNMLGLRLLCKLWLFYMLCPLTIAFDTNPQLFHYYRSTKYTLSKPLPGKTHSFDQRPFGINIFHQATGAPHEGEAKNPDAYFYDLVNNDDNTNTDSSYHSMGNNKNNIDTTMGKQEGSFCRRSFDGRSGYCILAYQCLHAIKDHRKHGTKIDICTYERNLPVICCPLAGKHVEPQSISAKKCQQYNDVLQGVKFNVPREFSGKTCVPSLPMIVGGRVVNEGEYPHMAALGWTQINNGIRWGCGGTLISELYVLTAAHCATTNEKPPEVVRLGAPNLNENSTDTQNIQIAVIILHPEFRSFSYYNDIALIKLARQAKISPKVKPACLWQLPDIGISTVVATGWGRTEFRGSQSDNLQKVELSMISQNLCKKFYKKERRLPSGIKDEQFCAGHMAGGKDTCQGDSGGPLHVEVPELKCVKFVIGITSFGKFCAKPNAPGVYTQIYPYLDWIESVAFNDE
ncbi:serine protease snake [Anastrepha ludens]|uniref:serine protease snake n=1 Tax=Anastrepha ludens TaxID=28586 RepID=UPI0023AF4D5F|nr:serine protease snake [Anastrepha ludens]